MGLKHKIITSFEHKNSKLLGCGQKLFFLLVYLKNNPLQNFKSATFDISQPKVSETTKISKTIKTTKILLSILKTL